MNYPNLISLLRLLSVPFIIWFIFIGHFVASFILFVLAGLSDGLDGFLAKKLNAVSRLGSFLDPLADKAMLVSVYASLAWIGKLPIWLVFVVIFRDLMLVAGTIWLYYKKKLKDIRPIFISKINTCAQILLVTFVLCSLAFHFRIVIAEEILIYLVGLTTVTSAIAYFHHNAKVFKMLLMKKTRESL